MSQSSREVSPSSIYHIYNRGIDGKPIFQEPEQKYFFLNCMRTALKKYSVEIYAYCIMHNHFHFLVRGELPQIARFMKESQGLYGMTFNYYQDRKGHVFQSKYKSKCVPDPRYFWIVNRYIHQNPVKANYHTTMSSYRFSSFREYLDFDPDKSIISKKAIQFMEKSFPSLNAFLDFQNKNCFTLVEDIPEDTEIQLLEKEILALNHLKTQYPIDDWNEFQRHISLLPAVLTFLLNECHFSKRHAGRLLHLSPYRLNMYLKKGENTTENNSK